MLAADYKGFTVITDQSERAGGEDSAPAPYDLFVISLGTCAGFFVKVFCDSRGINTEDIYLTQELKFDPIQRKLAEISVKIVVPADFPKKLYKPLERAAGQCSVKTTIQNPPEFVIEAVEGNLYEEESE